MLARASFLAVAIWPITGLAQNAHHTREIVDAYLRLQSYCDTGTQSPAYPHNRESFERCTDRDGISKETWTYGDGMRVWRQVEWYDTEFRREYYTIERKGALENVILYRETPVSSLVPIAPGDRILVFAFKRLFGAETSRARIEQELDKYQKDPSRSDASADVLEQPEPGRPAFKRRLWRSTADGRIFKIESELSGVVVQLDSIDVDRRLSAKDLSHDVPLTARYSYANAPSVFLSALAVVILALTTLLWVAVVVIAGTDVAVNVRASVWKRARQLSPWATGAFAVLFVLSLGGGGHPPAALYVFALAMIAAVIAAAIFLGSWWGVPLGRLIRKCAGRHVGPVESSTSGKEYP